MIVQAKTQVIEETKKKNLEILNNLIDKKINYNTIIL